MNNINNNMYNIDNKNKLIYSMFIIDIKKLTQDELMTKWSQYLVHDSEQNEMVFNGSKEECELWIEENDIRGICELYSVLPGEKYYNWNRCINQLGIE